MTVPFVLSIGVGFAKAVGAAEGMKLCSLSTCICSCHAAVTRMCTVAATYQQSTMRIGCIAGRLPVCPLHLMLQQRPHSALPPASITTGFGMLTVMSVAPIISVLLASVMKAPAKAAVSTLARVSRIPLQKVSRGLHNAYSGGR